MVQLLEFREHLKIFYSKYTQYIIPVIKFILTLTALFILNSEIGYMAKLGNIFILLGLSLVSAFLPLSGVVAIVAFYMLANLFTLSIEVALTTFAIMLVMFFLYFMFLPGDCVIIVLLPILFYLKIPYVMPIILGLIGSLSSVIPLSFGVVLYFIIHFVSENGSVLLDSGNLGIMQRFMLLLNGLKENQTMYVILVAFVLTLVIVNLIHRLSIDHVWQIAIVTGIMSNLLILLMGIMLFGVDTKTLPISWVLIGNLIALLIAFVLQFFLFTVDYTRTEYAQFEDDDYYYYVKAVPKIAVTELDVQIKEINSRKGN